MTRETDEQRDRREFLRSCGRFATVTPPAMTLLLSTSLASTAIARSGGQSSAWGRGDSSGHKSFFDNKPEPEVSSKGSDQKSESKGSDQGSKGADQTAKGSDKASKGNDQTSKGSDKGSKDSDRASKGSDKPKTTDQGSKGSNQGSKRADQTSDGSDKKVSKGADQTSNGPAQTAGGSDPVQTTDRRSGSHAEVADSAVEFRIQRKDPVDDVSLVNSGYGNSGYHVNSGDLGDDNYFPGKTKLSPSLQSKK